MAEPLAPFLTNRGDESSSKSPLPIKLSTASNTSEPVADFSFKDTPSHDPSLNDHTVYRPLEDSLKETKITSHQAIPPDQTRVKPPSHIPNTSNENHASSSQIDEPVLDLEKIGAIPVPHKINRQAIEQKKLRTSLTVMGLAFGFLLTVITSLAGYGGWQIWQKVTAAQTAAGSLDAELRTQIRDINSILAELRSDLAETRATASALSEQRRVEAAERKLISDTVQSLVLKFEEIEGGTGRRLRSLAITENEIQELRKELVQLRTSLNTYSNRTSSDVASLTRRVETIENFLTRVTQANQRTESARR